MIEEKKVWQTLCSGSIEALEILFKEYFDELTGYGRKISSDHSLVEDVIQDLFMYLWERHASLSNVDKVKSYIFIAYKRRLIKELQKQNKFVEEESSKEHRFELSMEDMLVVDELDMIKSTEVRRALLELGAKQKEAIYLKFHLGLSINEMSGYLEINPQSVKNLLSRTYKKLRQDISQELILYLIHRLQKCT